MVNNSERELDLLFYALSDSTRRSMLARLAAEELSVTEIAEPYDVSLAAISKHLKVLERANFIERTKEGRTFRCRANLEPLDDIYALLESLGAFWRKSLDSLDEYFKRETESKGEKEWRTKKQRK